MSEMTDNGAARLQAFGAYLGNLFASRSNVIWMAGGDYGTDTNQFTSAQLAVESALLSGVQVGDRSFDAFGRPNGRPKRNAVDEANFGPEMTLNGVLQLGRRDHHPGPARLRVHADRAGLPSRRTV